MALANTISHRLSIWGEERGIHALAYNPGVMRSYDWFAQQDAPGFAARLIATFGLVRYLDVGAGTGRFTEALQRQGAFAEGCEYSRVARFMAARRGVRLYPFDLTADDAGPSRGLPYDVAFCLEVAEHLPANLGDRLVCDLTVSPTVVFTAAPPGQGGTGHINEQPPSYWEERFARWGHVRRPDLEAQFAGTEGHIEHDWLLENLMVFGQH